MQYNVTGTNLVCVPGRGGRHCFTRPAGLYWSLSTVTTGLRPWLVSTRSYGAI